MKVIIIMIILVAVVMLVIFVLALIGVAGTKTALEQMLEDRDQREYLSVGKAGNAAGSMCPTFQRIGSCIT